MLLEKGDHEIHPIYQANQQPDPHTFFKIFGYGKIKLMSQ